jgi:hypothetical protein
LKYYGKKMEQESFDPVDVISCHKEDLWADLKTQN